MTAIRTVSLKRVRILHHIPKQMKEKLVILLCTLAGVHLTLAEQNYTEVVQLKNGKIKGLVIDTGDQKTVEFFQAIRYGELTNNFLF